MKDVRFEKLEYIITKQLSNRGMDKLALTGELENAAYELNESHTVVIVTGFVIKKCMIGETDGPLGVVELANTLEKLDKNVIIVTDTFSESLIRAGINTLRLQANIYIFEHGNEELISNEILDKYKPDHIIGIERPGRNKFGRCYSMIGEDITDYCPNTDILFEKARKLGIKTSAVGDGGNEVGMGKIEDYVAHNVNKGELICAGLGTDNLVVAAVSNWGAHAISAALSIINKRMLMYDESTEVQVLKSIVEAGAVDGCTKKQEATVDGQIGRAHV